MHTTSKKTLAIIVALVMLLTMAPMSAWEAFAASSGSNIDMEDTNPTTGTGWTYNQVTSVYMIEDGANVIVTGINAGQRRLEVSTGAIANITLSNVTINGLGSSQSPLKLNTGATANLTITGTNSLTAGDFQAGINAPAGTTLSIVGNGVLNANGGNSAAGIGGGYDESGGNIKICDGTINATSTINGAGIGGGSGGSGGTITIYGGTVHATSNGIAAGIGGGYEGDGGNIKISGGTVYATSNQDGAGIGGGFGGNGGTITISGGTVNATASLNGAGIGGGGSGSGGVITICGEAKITAQGATSVNNIGGGSPSYAPGVQFIAAPVNNDPVQSYKVVGNPTLAAGLTADIPAGQTMTIPKGSTLTVAGTIHNEGDLNVEDILIITGTGKLNNKKSGAVDISGTLENDNVLDNDGVITIENGGTLDNKSTLNNYDGSITKKEDGLFMGNIPHGNPVKDAGADVSKPTVNGMPTKTTISVNAVSLLSDTGQQIQYAISTGQTEPKDGWQDGTEFTGLTVGTTYYVFARSKANDTYATGEASMSDPITTKAAATPVAPSANATTATTAAKNVTAIRTPLKAIHMKRGQTLTPPVCADSKDPVTKKPHITAKLTWSSSNPKIATVNTATGKIKAKKVGKAKITAKALNGRKLTITVNVVKSAIPLKTLTLKKAPTSLQVGKARLLSVKTIPYQATNLNVTFSSSNRSILSVDKAGKITAKKKGKATITIKANGKKYVKTITVK
jgi:hypothetical protein